MRTLDSRALGSPDSASLVPICFLVFFMCDGQPVVGTVSTPFDFSTGPGLKSSFDRQYCSYAQCCHNLRRRRSVFLRWWPQSQVSTDSIADLSSDVRICVDVVRFFYVGGHNIYLPGGSGLTFWRHWSPKIAFGFCWSLPMRAEARWPRRLFGGTGLQKLPLAFAGLYPCAPKLDGQGDFLQCGATREVYYVATNVKNRATSTQIRTTLLKTAILSVET